MEVMRICIQKKLKYKRLPQKLLLPFVGVKHPFFHSVTFEVTMFTPSVFMRPRRRGG
jgi:hypothetical protein